MWVLFLLVLSQWNTVNHILVIDIRITYLRDCLFSEMVKEIPTRRKVLRRFSKCKFTGLNISNNVFSSTKILGYMFISICMQYAEFA